MRTLNRENVYSKYNSYLTVFNKKNKVRLKEMGIKGLWTVLTPYSEKKSLHEVSNTLFM